MNKEIDFEKGLAQEPKEINLKTGKEIKPKGIKDIFANLSSQIKAFNQTPEETKKAFLQVISMSPELKKATPQSLILAIVQINETGLSLDPRDGEISIIPYKVEQGIRSEIVAQIQFQWKGFRKILMRDVKGVVGLITQQIKSNDIIKLDPLTNKATFHKDFLTDDFNKQMLRNKQVNIGTAGVIFLNKEVFGQENFTIFMSNDEIKEHRARYSKTKINDFDYARKTLAKKVFKEFKDKMAHKNLFKNNNNIMNDVIERDQSAIIDNNRVYVDNPGEK